MMWHDCDSAMFDGCVEYRQEMGGLLGTVFVGIAINILTAETDAWWGPLKPVTQYPYLWLPLCLVGWFIWRYIAHRRAAVVWRSPASPYPGLSPYDEDRAAVFFGRDRETREILDRLQRAGNAPQQRVVAIVGPSGVGKSSLLRAGVVPRSPKRWRVVGPIRPATDPFLAMAAALTGSEDAVRAARSLRHETQEPEVLTRLSGPTVLIVDQLEDLYTLTGDADREAWWGLMGRLLALLPELRLLVAVRPEFRRRLTGEPGALVTRPVAVGPLDTAGIREVIVRPARAAGITFEDDLVDRIVADATVGDALPLLGHLLQRLSADRRITIAQYENAGEVGGAIATHAGQVYESLAGQFPADLIDRVLLRGISLEDDHAVRRPIPRSSLDEAELQILEEFRTARLVVDVADGDSLELTHDALIRHWSHLAHLISDNAARLRQISRLEHRATAWQAQPRHDDLLRGQTLADAVTLAEKATVSSNAHQLIEASKAAERNERISRSEQVADSAQRLHDQDRELAVALARAAIIDLAPSTAANATLWGLTTSPDISRLPIGHTTGITSVIWLPDGQLRTADQAGRVCTWSPSGRLTAVSFAVEAGLSGKTLISPDGRHALTEHDRGAGLWHVQDNRLLASRKGTLGASFDAVSWGVNGLFAGQFDWDVVDVYRLGGEKVEPVADLAVKHVRATAWSPRGDRLAVATDDHLRVFTIEEQPTLILQVEASWSAPTLNWLADGVHLAVSAAPAFNLRQLDILQRKQRTLHIYNTDDGTAVSSTPAGLHKALASGPDGKVLAFAIDQIRRHSRVALLDLNTGRTVQQRARKREPAEIAWSPDGTRVGLGASSGEVEIWDVPERRFRRLPTGTISNISWSPDRQRAVVARLGSPLEIIGVASGAPSQRLTHGPIHAFAWSPRGGLIATSSQEQVSVWDPATGELRAQWGKAPQRTFKRIRSSMTFSWVYSLAWSGDGTRLLAWNHDFWERTERSLTIWDAAEGHQLATLAGGEHSQSLLAWSPDSQLIAATVAEHDIAFWRGDDYSPAGRWQTEKSERISALAWSDESERLAIASESQIEVWSATEQRSERRWVCHDDTLQYLCWSPDGLYLAAVGHRKILTIWRTADGRQIAVIDCPSTDVIDLNWAVRLTVTTGNGEMLSWAPPNGFPAPSATANEAVMLSIEDRKRYGLADSQR